MEGSGVENNICVAVLEVFLVSWRNFGQAEAIKEPLPSRA